MSIASTANSKEERERKLAVSPRRACEMLDVGFDKLYDLMRAGKILSYLDGSIRKIDVASIHAYHASMLEASKKFRPRSPHGAR